MALESVTPDSMTPRESPTPGCDCNLCPRLMTFRHANRTQFPKFFNAPVPSFGSADARLLVVGLAPGLKGANQTGRPFTGDYAGDLLYATLAKFGFTRGHYAQHAKDGLDLVDCRITNAVRCVPPENKPTTVEIKTCRKFLERELATLENLKIILALGTIAHGAVLTALGHKKSQYPFGHGTEHRLPNGLVLADSYHCSRYNTNTGRLTVEMFEAVFARIRARLN